MATIQERHPNVFVGTHEDPRKRVRTVPMEVLSCGFSRTATTTMKAALETLGYPTWHFMDMAKNFPDITFWSDLMLRKFTGGQPASREEFDMLLGQYGATTDQPAAVFCEELIHAYPDAKVILVERETESWYKSYSTAIINGNANPWIPLASWIDSGFMSRVCRQTDILMTYYFRVSESRTKYGFFNNPKAFDMYRANARQTYQMHNDMVKRVVPPERLLLFSVADGWEPLCRFLGKPVPDKPFPRLNETAAFEEKTRAYLGQSYKRGLIKLARYVGATSVVLLAAILYYRRA